MKRYIKEFYIKNHNEYYLHCIENGRYETLYKSFGDREIDGLHGQLPSDFDWKGNELWRIIEIPEDELFLEML